MSLHILPPPTGRIALYKAATSPTRKHTIKGRGTSSNPGGRMRSGKDQRTVTGTLVDQGGDILQLA